MAYTDFTPLTRIQEAQDGKSFRIWDESTWTGESALTTDCWIDIFFINDEEVTIQYDSYPLINGVDTTKYDEYLTTDGHVVLLSDLLIDGQAPATTFEDGFYIIRVVYTDGTYATGEEPYYDNEQAFLAKNRMMKRMMSVRLLSWPMTPEVYRKNRDIFLQGLYLESAENAVDLGKKVQFRSIMALVKAMFNYYEIEESW